MDFYINPTVFCSAFTVPSSVVERHLKLAKGEHIKVLLYILKNAALEPEAAQISDACGISEYDAEEALLYWAEAGILLKKDIPEASKTPAKKAVIQEIKPTRTDVAKRGAQDVKIRYLLRETQLKLGRNLKTNEASTLVWLYDDQGFDVSLILLIVQYAVQHKRANLRFIESVAVDWINKGIDNISDADEALKQIALKEQSWGIVSRIFGLERRKPSAKENDTSFTWLNEWGMSEEMLLLAYEECVNQKSKFSFPYVAKIIENWHEKGYKTPEDLKKQTESGKSSKASYDIDLFEKMLNSKE